MTEKYQEKINIAIAIQALTSSVDFMKGQLTEMSVNMKGLTSKTETDEVKKDFTKIVEEIKNAMLLHNKSDEKSFSSIGEQNDNLKKIIYMWIGGLAVITFLIPIVIKLVWSD